VTKKCPDGSRRIDETGRLRRDRSSVQNGEFGPVGRQCDIQNCVEREVSKPLADDSKTLPTPTSTPALKTGGTAPTRNNEGDCDLRQDLDPDQHGSPRTAAAQPSSGEKQLMSIQGMVCSGRRPDVGDIRGESFFQNNTAETATSSQRRGPFVVPAPAQAR
jgi:hypothetical protein